MLRIAPLFPVAVGLIVGILVDHAWAPAAALYLAIFAVGCSALLVPVIRQRYTASCIVGLALAGGGVLHWSTARRIPQNSIERFADRGGTLLRVTGRVVSEPRRLPQPENPFAQWISKSERTAFVLAVEAVESSEGLVPVSGRVRVTVYETVLDLWLNDRCEVFGRMSPLSPPANPGGFDWERHSRAQGIVARLSCRHRENVRILGGASAVRWAPLVWLRATATKLLTDDLPVDADEEASLLETMLLGQRSRLSARLNEVFIRAGCIHFLAVSGVHLVIVMLLARVVFRVLGAGNAGCTWGMMAAIVAYALLAEPRPPILRAAIIGLIYCTARLLGRERAYLNWVSAAAIVLLVFDPRMLFDVGFQLSFAAVLGVSYLAPALKSAARKLVFNLRNSFSRGAAADDRRIVEILRSRAGPRSVVRRSSDWLMGRTFDGLSIGCAAWLAGLPIIAATFYRIQPWGALNSFLLMPFVTLIMALGFVKAMVAAVSPTAGAWVGAILSGVDGFMLQVVERMADLPGASAWASPPPWWMGAVFYAFLIAFALRHARRLTPPKFGGRSGLDTMPSHASESSGAVLLFPLPKYTARAGLTALVLTAAMGSNPLAGKRPLTITVLAVGQGSATVIELPDGRTMLYDAGTSYSSDVGRNTVVPFLRSRGVRHLDQIIVSHADLDHFSGIPTVLDEVPAGPVVTNALFERFSHSTRPSRHFLFLLEASGHPVQVLKQNEATWELGGVTFEWLWPDAEAAAHQVNDTSSVLRITYRGRSVLLSGDIDESAQDALLARGDLAADVLFLPHHGSVRRTTREFIRAVGADALIRSSNERMADTLSGLPNIVGDTPIYNTADHGAIIIRMDETGLKITTHLEGQVN